MKNLKKISREELKSVKGGFTQEQHQFCNSRGLFPCLYGGPIPPDSFGGFGCKGKDGVCTFIS